MFSQTFLSHLNLNNYTSQEGIVHTTNMASITSIVKVSDWILSRPTLAKIVTPVAKTFVAYAGYREMGLKYVQQEIIVPVYFHEISDISYMRLLS